MRKKKFSAVLPVLAALLPFLFTGCGEAPSDRLERVPTNLSDVFEMGAKAYAGHAAEAGWLVPNPADGGSTWLLDNTTPSAAADAGGTPYDGMRVWNVDGDLPARSVPFDGSEYDGVIFKYRTNCTEVTPKFIDFGYRWAVYGIGFKAFDYANGAAAPGEYKEIVVPFYKAVRNVEALSDFPDNNPDNFDYNQIRQLTFDMRSSVDGGAYWLEIVDFDFFVYK